MTRNHFIAAIILLLIASPIGVYIYHFGLTVSSEHDRWAQMGSAFAGIYAPMTAVGTLIILYMQYQVQVKIQKTQQKEIYWSEQKVLFQNSLEVLRRNLSTDRGKAALRSACSKNTESLTEDEKSLTQMFINKWKATNQIISDMKDHGDVGGVRIQLLTFEAANTVEHGNAYLLDILLHKHGVKLNPYYYAPELNSK